MTRIIDLKTLKAGPAGVLEPGKHTVSKKDALALVTGKHAEYADGLPPELETAVFKAPEKAVKPPVEKAVVKQVVTPVVAPVGNLTKPPTWGAK